eukprot:2169424-Pyramimonas_sp.AAC.1
MCIRDSIRRMIAKRHRAHRHVDAAAVDARAEQLPENGAPPELVRLLPYDNHLDKITVQKNATPSDAKQAT